jgi:hypothetical protein
MNNVQTSGSGMSNVLTISSSVPPIAITLTSPHEQKLEWFKRHFRPHFDQWVFDPINRLVPSQDALIGFILMSCAIDYLAGFLYGKSTKGHVQSAYTDFIIKYFPPSYKPDDLYDSLRNGLVHMFTIKDKYYYLTHNHPELHLKQYSGTGSPQIILNAESFRDDLSAAKDKYFDEVETRLDLDLLDHVVDRYTRDGFLVKIAL